MRAPLHTPLLAAALTLALAGCNGDSPGDTEGDTSTGTTGADVPEYDWGLPDWYPVPAVPEDNPMTEDKVELGRYLFYDERMSGNGTMSCGSCHEQARAFSDGVALPMGSTGDTVPKNSMQLSGAALFATYTWASPLIETFEQQALNPMFGDSPIELGMADREDEILQRFRDDATYQELFPAAFRATKTRSRSTT